MTFSSSVYFATMEASPSRARFFCSWDIARRKAFRSFWVFPIVISMAAWATAPWLVGRIIGL